jgi:uncharacterized delta-60 repeat protein
VFNSLKSWLRGEDKTSETKCLKWQPSLTSLEARENPSGNLDLSFAASGRVTADFQNADSARSVVVQPDGKILVAGTADDATANFAVARYNPDGSLDTTFSGDGRHTLTFGSEDICTGMALQADGRIVLVGYTDIEGTNDFAVARLNADGTPDTFFSGDGQQIIDFGFDDRASSVVIQPNGRIVVGGSIDGGSANFAFARLNTNGTLDSNFDGDGRADYTFGNADFCTSIALQADGKIVAGGYTNNGGTNDFAALRMNADGSLDATFDADGKQTVNFGDDDRANAVLVQADGKIVLAGAWDGGQADYALVRLNTNGSLDSTFSGDGKANFSFAANGFGQAEFATGVVQQKDGKLVVVGYTDNNNAGGANNIGVLRLNADGTLDSTFSGDGKQQVNFLGDDLGYAVALQNDGKIVVAGTTTTGGVGANSHNFAVGRLVGRDTDLIGRTSSGGWWVNHTTGSAFAVSNPLNWNEAAGWKDVQTGDVNNDGLSDIVGRTSNGQWWVARNNGNGTYTNTQFAAWDEAAGWKDVKVGDFNGDGMSDVAGRTSGGQWWVGTSNGTAFATGLWAGWNEAANWKDVKFADYNGDGKTDVAGRSSDGGWWVGLANNAGTAFTTTQFGGWNEAANWRDVSVGDFNGDGRADVLGRTAGGEWWVGTSNGTTFASSLFAGWNEAANWKDVRVADFNGDGRADVVGRASDGSLWVGTSTGNAFTTTQWGGWNEAAGWKDVTVGDYNGDGRMDLAARTSGGEWYVGTSTGVAFGTTLWATWNEAAGWKDVMSGTYVG